ncbi:2-methylcitrate dehydratase [Phaffia rhodozyma]|uniref:2-methylcitrate dehydratase n=1 Tax=Phaffia rhodozyma TaxID=264483 RepID=A0A0F7SH93_PHARH|nr:2-methylcitrate dehydratase [Phaffia rhodozyma]
MSSYSASGESTLRPPPDEVLTRIASYIHQPPSFTPLAYQTARLCLLDTIGCGLEGLRVSGELRAVMGPVVEGAELSNGAKVIGTNYKLDPVQAAFNIGAMIRWLDFNDCFLAAEWGHPSDSLGTILAITSYLSNTDPSKKFTVKDVLEAMIQAHEVQGGLALLNSLNRVGLDHVAFVKIASTAVASKLMGFTEERTIDALSQAFVDGQSLRTYRHAPNTGPRKSWAAGDACARAVWLCLMVKKGQIGYPSALTAKKWGFYDVLFAGKPFEFQREFGCYVMENVLFKISYPAEFHAQTAVEAAHTLHGVLKSKGLSSDDIKSVKIRTQEAAIRIIDKSGPLHNYADRDHTLQYMAAIPLIFGRLTTEDYSDDVASDHRIDELREKMVCVEEKQFSVDYLDPEKRSIGNAITLTLKDGTVLDEVVVEYPVGHRRRRDEGTPLLLEKFKRHIVPHFSPARQEEIMAATVDLKQLEQMPLQDFVDLWIPEK